MIFARMLQTPIAFVRYVLNSMKTIFYRSEGQVVPRIKNPLLLKPSTELTPVILYRVLHIPLAFIRYALNFTQGILQRYEKKIVPPVKNPLLLKSATELAQNIRERKCKSVDVVQAYIGRILEVEPFIHATAETCFAQALEKSREVDAVIASGKYTKEKLSLVKPLFGVPVSIKCLFHVKNLPCTAGCPLYSYLKANEDASAVAALKNAGAIVITTTNVPELGLDIENSNKLYGTTCNPYDTSRTPGGSSGGEAALISAGASMLGLGNDLMGSLRIPAHFCGVFSHKPSKGLVSNHGTFPIERPDIRTEFCNPEVYKYLSSGPICRYAEDLVTSMKVLSLHNQVRLRFDYRVDFKRLKIYYLKEIQSPMVVPVEKDIAAALKSAVSHFEKNYNITPQEVKMPYLFDANRCVMSVMDPLFRSLKASTIGERGLGLNEKLEFLKFLLGKSKLCLSTFFHFNSGSVPLLYKDSQSSYYEKMTAKWKEEFNKILDENTVLLMPTLPFTAPYHSQSFPLLLSVCYTSVFNVLGLPATHCPMGFTKQGLPCGIQIVSCHNNDPLTIACAVELEKAFGGWKSC